MASEQVWVKAPHWKKWHRARLSLDATRWLTNCHHWAGRYTAETSDSPPVEDRCNHCERAGA
jgi:hypothetical protein